MVVSLSSSSPLVHCRGLPDYLGTHKSFPGNRHRTDLDPLTHQMTDNRGDPLRSDNRMQQPLGEIAV